MNTNNDNNNPDESDEPGKQSEKKLLSPGEESPELPMNYDAAELSQEEEANRRRNEERGVCPEVLRMTPQEREAHMQQCQLLKLVNGITPENAFQLQIIDCMTVTAKDLDVTNEETLCRFQISLDVYGSRLDGLSNDAQNLAKSLNESFNMLYGKDSGTVGSNDGQQGENNHNHDDLPAEDDGYLENQGAENEDIELEKSAEASSFHELEKVDDRDIDNQVTKNEEIYDPFEMSTEDDGDLDSQMAENEEGADGQMTGDLDNQVAENEEGADGQMTGELDNQVAEIEKIDDRFEMSTEDDGDLDNQVAENEEGADGQMTDSGEGEVLPAAGNAERVNNDPPVDSPQLDNIVSWGGFEDLDFWVENNLMDSSATDNEEFESSSSTNYEHHDNSFTNVESIAEEED